MANVAHSLARASIRLALLSALSVVGGCDSNAPPAELATASNASKQSASAEPAVPWGEIVGSTTRSEHRGDDDLLTAGLGLDGLRSLTPPALTNAEAPTEAELRQRAFWANWRGIADLRPGEHGESYGAIVAVPGIEVRAHGKLRATGAEHNLLFQLPDSFNGEQSCLIVTAASGSRGEYGAIALAGGWALPKGCAVVHTDKGAGTHWTQQGEAVAVPHANSTQHPDSQWGAFVLAAAEFGLQQLNAERPSDAPFSADNTRIIAFGVSNGGGAVLQAAGLTSAPFDAVVAVAPNVLPGVGGRALYDYASEAALLMPCAMLDKHFEATPFARPQAVGEARCRLLTERGEIEGANLAEQSAAALARLRDGGWTDAALESAAFTTAFDLWRAVAVTYASSYLAADPKHMPCGYRFQWRDAQGQVGEASSAQQALWWSDSTGIPPSVGVIIADPPLEAAPKDDPAFAGLACLRDLWLAEQSVLKQAVAETRAQLPPKSLPIYVLHGEADGLVPMAFSGGAYVAWLKQQGLDPRFEALPGAQHFDAYVGLPQWAGRHPPLMPRAYALMDEAFSAFGDAP